MENITISKWVEKISNDPNAVVLDVRTPAEWAEGIQKGALMINFLDQQSFKEEIESFDKTKNYYLYCRSGNRSGQACQMFDALGFARSYNMLGGMLAWAGDTVKP